MIAVDVDLVVFEDVDVGTFGLGFKLADEFGMGAAVVFVVAEDVENIEDGLVGDVLDGLG